MGKPIGGCDGYGSWVKQISFSASRYPILKFVEIVLPTKMRPGICASRPNHFLEIAFEKLLPGILTVIERSFLASSYLNKLCPSKGMFSYRPPGVWCWPVSNLFSRNEAHWYILIDFDHKTAVTLYRWRLICCLFRLWLKKPFISRTVFSSFLAVQSRFE